MRLDARKGDTHWNVFHVPSARHLRHVVWVDAHMLLWCEAVHPYVIGADGEIEKRVHSARRIDILTHERLVFIDPVDDGDQDETVVEAIEAIGSAA